MAKRVRDRRGRFLKGRARVKSRRSRPRASNPPTRRRRSRRRSSARRTSNAPRRRRRRSGGRSRNAPAMRYRTRHVYHRARRRSNPAYTIVDALKAFLIVSGGFALAWWILPMAIVKLAKKPEWQQGWKPVGLTLASGVLVTLVGYGIGRLIGSKRTANMIAAQLAIGSGLAVAIEAGRAWKASKPATPPAQQQQAASSPAPQQAGGGYFSPKQMEAAAAAANVVRRQGQGYFSPGQYARATSGGVLLGGAWPRENNF